MDMYKNGPLNHTWALWGHTTVSFYRWGTHLQLQFWILLWTKVKFSPFQLSLLSQNPFWVFVAFCLVFLISFCLCTLCCFPEAPPSPPAQHPPWQQLCLHWATESPAASREVMNSQFSWEPAPSQGTWAHFSGLPFPLSCVATDGTSVLQLYGPDSPSFLLIFTLPI